MNQIFPRIMFFFTSEVVQQKSHFNFFALFYFFSKKQLTENSLHKFVRFKYVEALGQEYSKRNVFLKNLLN